MVDQCFIQVCFSEEGGALFQIGYKISLSEGVLTLPPRWIKHCVGHSFRNSREFELLNKS
jgi:hypothetical protein